MLHPPNRYLTSCLCSHHNVPFRPAWSKIHQASCSRVCGKGILLENKAGGRQKVGEPPWVCCGDPVIPGGLWPSSPCGAMDFSLAFLALCEAVNQHLLSAEWAMAGAETGLTTASGKNCPSSQLLCPCRGWEGFLLAGFCHMEHISSVCCLLPRLLQKHFTGGKHLAWARLNFPDSVPTGVSLLATFSVVIFFLSLSPGLCNLN